MELDPSYKDVLGIRKFTSVTNLKPGSVVQFTYDGEQKYALVLNPQWKDKMHAVSLPSLSSESIKNLLAELKNFSTPDSIYNAFKTSQYTSSRPYRTYIINKIKTLREIYLKEDKS